MDESFDKTFKNLEMWFRLAGINILNEVDTTQDRWKYRCIYFLHSFTASYTLFSCILWCIVGLQNGQNFLEIAYCAPCITINALAQIKGFFLNKHEKKARQLIAILKNPKNNENKRQKSIEKDEIVMTELRILNFVIKTLTIFYALSVGGLSFSPLVLIVVKYIQTKEVELALPFFCFYGFDPFQKIIWPFMYILHCWTEIAVVLIICSADYFFFTCCTYIHIQFRCLEHDLRNIIPTDRINNTFVQNEEFRNNFNRLIRWHQELIESANILEVIYSKSTLLNFVSSSVIICLTGFNITNVHTVSNMTTFLSFLFLSLLQVFFVCFFADLLTVSSMNISNGVYNSQLFTTEAKIKKNMLMVLLRSQTPCKITAAGYADVNLNSFMRVLSSAYSYFALLQTMYGN